MSSNQRTIRSAVAAFALAIGILGAGGAGASAVAARESATGSGHMQIGADYRSFAFSAVRHRDGSVTGQAQLKNRAQDVVTHVAIDCLHIAGNTATMIGTVTHDSRDRLEGGSAAFQVADNGEGSGDASDKVSSLLVRQPDWPPFTCGDPLSLPLHDVENGNVQVLG